jgi:aryl-alcohol dehydrogenase-like predicted oxidoreductase
MPFKDFRQRAPQLGLGLAALGRPGYINLGHDGDLGADKSMMALCERAWEVLDAARAGGIRFFDAARSYGRAESFLAGWLAGRRIPPEGALVASKWGYTYTAGWQVDAEQHEAKEHSLPMLRRQIKESRRLLGEHLALYQIHSATQASGVVENEAVLDELARLKASGLAIGLSVSGPGQAATIQQALQVERDGQFLFDTVQATWNLLESSATGALSAAHEAGLLVIIKEALANGRLTARNQAPNLAAQRTALNALCAELDCSLDALALATALAQPWAGVVLSGAATVAHLQSNLKAVDLELDQEHLAQLGQWAEEPDAYWQRRSQLDWN